MATLTWRNVDAPDFRGVADSLRTFSNLFGQATSGLGQGLAAFQQNQELNNDRTALAQALRFQDPAAYQEALRTGAINTAGTSAGGLVALDQRANNLLTQQGKALNNAGAAYGNERTQLMDLRTDAARDPMARLAQAAASGDQAGFQTALADPAIANLSPDQILKAGQAGQTMQGNRLDNQGQVIRNAQGKFNLDTSQNTENDNRIGMAAAQDIIRSSATGLDAVAGLERRTDLTPGQRAVAMQEVGKVHGNIYAPMAGATSAAPATTAGNRAKAPGSAGHGTQAGSPWDATVGFQSTAKPVTAMAIGEAIKYGEDVLIPSTRGTMGMPADQGSSAMGAYQITKGTLKDFAPKALGANWADQPLSPENQDKIAKEIFDARKNGNLKDTWKALPNSTPGAYKDMTWEQMRPLIGGGETATTAETFDILRTAGRGAGATRDGATVASVENRASNGNIGDFAMLAADNSSVAAVADELLKGPYKGANRANLIDSLRETANTASVTPAIAGRMLENSVRGASWYQRGEVVPDGTVLEQNIKNYREGGLLDGLGAERGIAAVATNIQNLQQQATTAAEQLAAITARARVQPGIRGAVPEAEARARAAAAALAKAVEDAKQYSPQFQAPKPVAKTTGSADVTRRIMGAIN